MNKITFRNNQPPALNDTNLNNLQTNVENEFKKMGIKVSDEEDSRYEINLIQSYNLFNKDDVINGYALDENGQAVASTGYSVSKYIPIKANNTYGYGVYNQELTPDLVICVYGADKTLLARYTRDTTSQGMFTAPTGSAYVRISDVNADLDYIQFSKGLFGSYEEYNVPKKFIVNGQKFTDTLNVSSNIDDRYKVNLLKTKNLFDKNSEAVGTFINPPTGEILSNSAWTNSNYIKVKPNTQYTYTTKNPNETISQITINYYNENTWLSGFQENDSDGGLWSYTFTTPANCNGVRVGYRNERNYQDIQLEEGSTATEYTPFIPNQINIDNEKYSDTINVGAVEDSRSRVNILHSSNLINPQFETTTQNGVTITNNGNGTYTINGTATDTVQFNIMTNLNLTGTYKMTGCPSTGSQETYYMFARNSAWSKFISDKGEGTIGTFDSTVAVLCITVANGVTCNNVVFKPMITEDTSKTYADFEPYIVPSIKVDNEEIYRKPKVLWENSSITSDFSNQTITLNDSLENYDYYEVIFLMSKYEQLALSSGLIPSSMSTSITTIRLAGGTGIIARYRDISRNSATTLMITKASKISGSSTTITEEVDRVIPYRIIGH